MWLRRREYAATPQLNLAKFAPENGGTARKADRGVGRYPGRRSHIAFRAILRVAKRPAFKLVSDIATLSNEKLQGAPFDFAFLGGSVLTLLVNDPTADAIRVTKDVDIIADVRTRKDFHREERELESRGFHHDTSEDAPICRWIADGIVVDVLPVREEVLGWKSKWFEDALKSATTVNIDGHRVKVISAPYFVALKLEAFEDRGRGDFICSTDFEDVICLFNGRPSVVDEILAEPAVATGITAKFVRYVKSPDLEDAILGFVQTESNPEARFTAILSAFKRLAEFR